MFEQLCAGIDTLAADLERRTVDQHRAQQDLRSKIIQLRAMGKSVPAHILKIESELDQQEEDDLYDNVPI